MPEVECRRWKRVIRHVVILFQQMGREAVAQRMGDTRFLKRQHFCHRVGGTGEPAHLPLRTSGCRKLHGGLTADTRRKAWTMREFCVDPGDKLRMKKLDPAYKGKHTSEAEAKQDTENYRQKLKASEVVLYAGQESILVVCRRSTPVARTARSITCSAHSIRKACVSLPSNSPPRPTAHDFL